MDFEEKIKREKAEEIAKNLVDTLVVKVIAEKRSRYRKSPGVPNSL
ncbi:hypothetical protein [Neobacillus piezotolerans]|nr:hypothetical protein [Neobacillus piezotolerans]